MGTHMINILKKFIRFIIDKIDANGRRCDASKKCPKAVVLTYHRVATLLHDPLMLAVSPQHFDEQLNHLKQNFEIVSLKELIARLRSRSLRGKELAITFDDGYIDNMIEALPIARIHNVPITIFVTSGILDSTFSFPWDKEYGNDKNAYLSKEDLDQLIHDPSVLIGAHTHTHPRLRTLDREDQKKEIVSMVSPKTPYLAYPYGGRLDFSRTSKKLAKEAGYEAAFATRNRIIMPQTDLYDLPRINVRDWNGTELVDRIKRYL